MKPTTCEEAPLGGGGEGGEVDGETSICPLGGGEEAVEVNGGREGEGDGASKLVRPFRPAMTTTISFSSFLQLSLFPLMK